MNRRIYVAPVLLAGLLTTQVIAAIQVYLSNAGLYRTLVAIRDHGYLTIPNELVMPQLQKIGPAFFGGLFFTLSLGVGLSIISLVAAWAWDRCFLRNKILGVLYLIFWLGFLIGVNYRGLNLMTTAYFLLVPPVAFRATLRRLPPSGQQNTRFGGLVYAAPVFLLALLWASQMDRYSFLDIRDNFLLSHPLGTRINDFYYDYTLYPAEVFKSLDQKMLKTCNLEGVRKEAVARAFERELRKYDYLNVSYDGPVDLKVVETGADFILQQGGRPILATTLKDFLSGAGQVLGEFSLRRDQHAFFRMVTFSSLLIGLPIALYILCFDLFRFGFGLFMGLKTSALVAAILCFFIAVSLLVAFSRTSGGLIEEQKLAEALKSENWRLRVAALKIVGQKGLDVSAYAAYPGLLSSPHIPVRYWLVRALGLSRQAHTYKDLVGFLDDPHPNVVRTAFYALGRRGDKRAVPEILKRIKTSQHWYNQWYAYKALRKLGWKQSRQKEG